MWFLLQARDYLVFQCPEAVLSYSIRRPSLRDVFRAVFRCPLRIYLCFQVMGKDGRFRPIVRVTQRPIDQAGRRFLVAAVNGGGGAQVFRVAICSTVSAGYVARSQRSHGR